MKVGLGKRLEQVEARLSGDAATSNGDMAEQLLLSPVGEIARRVAFLVARADQPDATDHDRAVGAHFIAWLTQSTQAASHVLPTACPDPR